MNRPHLSSQKRSDFGLAGDVLKLVSGTTSVQIIAVLASPIMTRLYAPEAFGFLALFVSISSLLTIVACLRYEVAIPLPKNDLDASALVLIGLCFTTLVSLLTFLLLILFGNSFAKLLNAQELINYFWIIPSMVWLSGVSMVFTFWNTRTRNFGRISISNISGSLTTSCGKMASGFAGFNSGGNLITATVVGQIFSTGLMAVQTIISDSGKVIFQSRNKLRRMYAQIIRYRKFPLVDAWGALLNNASWQIPPLLFAAFFSQTVVGYYALAFRLIQLPMALIGTSLGQAFYPRIAKSFAKKESVSSLVEKMFNLLVLLGLLPATLFAVAGPELFSVVFGPVWREAGVYSQILSPWVFVWFVSSPLSVFFNAIERQGLLLKFHLLIFSTRLVSILIGSIYQDMHLALKLFSLTGVLVYGLLCLTTLKMSSVHLPKIMRSVIPYFGLCCFLALPILTLKYLGARPVYILVSCGFSTFIYSIFTLWRTSYYQIIFKRFQPSKKQGTP